MSDTIPQSVSNGCRKYVKSRIIINTFNTFNNVIRLIVLAVITLLVLLLGSIVIAWLFIIIGDGWEYRREVEKEEKK